MYQLKMAANALIFVLMLVLCTTVVLITAHKLNGLLQDKPTVLLLGESTDSTFIVERFTGVSVELVTDKLTGCEYLMSTSGITPRMYSDGIQVCGQSTYPNGEHDGHLSN